jgi:hypothetical protein
MPATRQRAPSSTKQGPPESPRKMIWPSSSTPSVNSSAVALATSRSAARRVPKPPVAVLRPQP